MLDALEPLFCSTLPGPGMSVGVPLSGRLEVRLADGWRLEGGCSRQTELVQVPPEHLVCTSCHSDQ